MVDPNRIFQGPFGRAVLLEMTQPLVEHAHSQYHLLFKISGFDGAMSIGGTHVPLSDDSIVLINAWEPHGFVGSTNGPCLVLAFYLESDWLGTLSLGAAWNRPNPRFEEHCVLRTAFLRKLLDRFVGHILYDALVDQQVLQDLIAEAPAKVTNAVNSSVVPHSKDYRISRAIQQIRSDSGALCDTSQLATIAGLSVPHFFERFKTCTGLTPRAYTNVLRMEAALSSLSKKDVVVSRVAADLGFSAQSNFTRFFRQHVGISPASYQRVLHVLN